MRNIIIILALAILIGCDRNRGGSPPETYSDYTPVLMKRTVLESSVAYEAKRDIKNPGKIYTRGDYIFINEMYEGIHVINNTNPQSPVNEGFLRIPGCVDIAVKSNTLYADNATDLVAIDLSDMQNYKLTTRVKNVFPEILPPDQDYMPYIYDKENRPENTVIVKWVKIVKE